MKQAHIFNIKITAHRIRSHLHKKEIRQFLLQRLPRMSKFVVVHATPTIDKKFRYKVRQALQHSSGVVYKHKFKRSFRIRFDEVHATEQ